MPFTDAALQRLEGLRIAFGFPMVISSGYRCPDHNEDVSSSGRDGPHTIYNRDNITVDVLVATEMAYKLIHAALNHGFRGIGVSQKGHHSTRFLHLDCLWATADRLRPTLWSY